MVAGGRKVEAEAERQNVNVGIPWPLVDEVDRFLAEHAELGITNRNEFARRAVMDLLRQLRYESHINTIVEAHKSGTPGPLEQLKRLKS